MTSDPKRIVLVTCVTSPTLSASDTALAAELTGQGHQVQSLPWNGAAPTDFTSADLVVLRSNWDYHHDLGAFDAWLALLEASGVELHNPATLVRSHLDKSYLGHLMAAGFRVPYTLVTEDFNLDIVGDWVAEQCLEQVVVKPAWGASGHGVELVRRSELTALASRWSQDPARRSMLVQEYLPAAGNGETSLVFFAGEFSHALIRRPAPGDFRVNSQYGGSISHLPDVDPALVDFGAKLEAVLPERATYARIDVVIDGADPIVMEVEVNEPALGLDLAPGSAARFAAALVG